MNKRRFQFTPSAPEPGGSNVRLVSMLSGKGGVGKSVLAFNLAERLTAAGKRVLLIDLDVDCGNLHILANQACRYGVSQLVAEELTLAEAVTPVNDKLDLLAATGHGWPRPMTPAAGAARSSSA